MVKNFGGNKAKGFAHKHTTKKTSELRTSKDELEVYVQVTKMSGGSICRANTLDGTELICHIRGKFRGRGKRDNFIGNGTWMLVGLREWEDVENKRETKNRDLNCDIIEVYNDTDKKNLKNTITNIDWMPFIKNDTSSLEDENVKEKESNDNGFMFADEKTQEYKDILDAHIKAAKLGENSSIIDVVNGGEELVEVDDI